MDEISSGQKKPEDGLESENVLHLGVLLSTIFTINRDDCYWTSKFYLKSGFDPLFFRSYVDKSGYC